jgi:hypothetical protein
LSSDLLNKGPSRNISSNAYSFSSCWDQTKLQDHPNGETFPLPFLNVLGYLKLLLGVNMNESDDRKSGVAT